MSIFDSLSTFENLVKITKHKTIWKDKKKKETIIFIKIKEKNRVNEGNYIIVEIDDT